MILLEHGMHHLIVAGLLSGVFVLRLIDHIKKSRALKSPPKPPPFETPKF